MVNPRSGASQLDPDQLRARAGRCRLVISDVDGVLTDAGVYYSAEGEIMKRFSIRDGMGVERLRNAGIETAIVTGEHSPSVRQRADKLGIAELHLGAKDKVAVVGAILERRSLSLGALAYIGDDVNDLPALQRVGAEGLTGAPEDAVRAVRDQVHFTADAKGGYGAFRAFADWILALRMAT